MSDHELLAERFQADRDHLRGVAFRMLGSLAEADDAVQEAWIRLSRSDTSDVENLTGWLTTVVARVCLDMLRSRDSRREEPIEPDAHEHSANPEQEAQLADAVGLAMLVVMNTLEPAERLAFVLHDMFAVPFDEIASIIGRSPDATRQLASRARRRVRGAPSGATEDVAEQRRVVDRFLAAMRAGDFEALVAVLDPDFVVRSDGLGVGAAPRETRGAETWAKGAIQFSRAIGTTTPTLIDGAIGLVMAPRGKLRRAVTFTIAHGRITSMEIIGDAEPLSRLEIATLPTAQP